MSYARYDVPFESLSLNEFRGVNRTPARINSEMSDMMNLSSGNYPYLSPRSSRDSVELPEGIGDIEKIFRANGKLCFIAGGRLWYDGKAVGAVSVGTEKSVAVCNGKICIAPDMVYYDYLNGQFWRMDGKVNIYVSRIYTELYRFGSRITVCRNTTSIVGIDFPWGDYVKVGDKVKFYYYSTGETSDEYIVSEISKDNSDDTGIVLTALDGESIGTDTHTMRAALIINDWDVLVFEASKLAVTNDKDNDTYTYSFGFADGVGISALNNVDKFSKIFLTFEKDDVIKIGDSENEYIIKSIDHGKSSCEICFDKAVPEDESVLTLTRTVPEMNYICERDNRLFGVCSSDNTVVASKLGQPLNYRYFSGTSVDSYSVEVGSDGEFTGIAVYNGNIVLFKERYIHLLSGSKPSMYRLSGVETYGCQKGSSESICSLSGRLFYKSPGGIYVFDGSYPVCISRTLGDEKYTNAFAADDDRRYYVYMEDAKGNGFVFVYDTDTGFWYIEDGKNAVSMCELSGDIYIAEKTKVLKCGTGTEVVPWSAVMGPFDLYTENKKVVSSVALRFKLPQGSSLRVEVSCDDGAFEVMKEIFYSSDTVLFCEIPIKRCDEFALRLSGKGDIKIRGLSFKVRESTGVR